MKYSKLRNIPAVPAIGNAAARSAVNAAAARPDPEAWLMAIVDAAYLSRGGTVAHVHHSRTGRAYYLPR